ncbi:hypothetical protein BH09VER1_BH09VER1_46230 [soil metagenome]
MRPALFVFFLTILSSAHAEESPLKALYDRSDLIIYATFLEDVSAGISTSEIYQGKPILDYVETAIHVRVNRVLKGTVSTDRPLLIGVTIMFAIPSNKPIRMVAGAPVPAPGVDNEPWLKKGDRSIIFLEDRRKREPNSTAVANGEPCHFRTFDYWLWRIPANDAIDIQFAKWKKD